MEHTKAPWFYVDYAGSYTLQSGPYYSDPTILDYDGICDNHVDKETAEANARLASKSPEMLEALKEELNFLEIVYSRINYPGARHLEDIRYDINSRKKQIESLIEELT
jgi:hypothetical protein